MCIFAFSVEKVTNTRIAVVALPDGRQLTVYENSVFTTGSNCMILPIPSGTDITLIDLSSHKRFWENCEAFFPRNSNSFGAAGWGFAGGFSDSTTLPVEHVGGYKCTIVPSIADINRVHPQFKLPSNVQELLSANYKDKFSFLVCLFEKRVSGHPIAYLSSCLPDGTLFIPTRHEHGGRDAAHVAAPAPRRQQRGGFFNTDFSNDGPNSNNVSLHENIHCDRCRKAPLIGSRHKCIQCKDFDLCSDCYVLHKEALGRVHDPKHVFVEYLRPRENHPSDVQIDPKGVHMQVVDDGYSGYSEFDHTLYLFNAISTSIDVTQKQDGSGQTTLGLNPYLKNLEKEPSIVYAQKITINGSFPNKDYYAARIR